MENATKALVMAGAILIAILLISAGLVVINSTKGVIDQGAQSGKLMEINMFNSKFEAYEGIRTGAEVKQLINLVRVSNDANPDHKIRVYGKDFATIVNTAQYNVIIIYSEENGSYTWNSDIGNLLVGSETGMKREKGYICRIELDKQ